MPTISSCGKRSRSQPMAAALSNSAQSSIVAWKPRSIDLYPQRRMKEVLVSGCRDNQYSYDARIDGTYHGAMTYFALRTIVKLPTASDGSVVTESM